MTNAQPQPLLYEHICADPMNADFAAQGWPPVYSASARSRIIIVGQAPGRIAQETGVPWNDASGAPNDSGWCLCAEVLSCPPGREKFNENGGAFCTVFAGVFPTGAPLTADCALAST